MLGDADPEAPDQLGLRRRAAQLLHELVPGTLDLVRPHAGTARQGIHLPQLIEYGPPDLGDGIRLELGATLWIVGLHGVQEPEEPPTRLRPPDLAVRPCDRKSCRRRISPAVRS